MEIAILKATNEFILVTEKTKEVAGEKRYQVVRRFRDCLNDPSPEYREWLKEEHFVKLDTT